jgi:hypothetical protein
MGRGRRRERRRVRDGEGERGRGTHTHTDLDHCGTFSLALSNCVLGFLVDFFLLFLH